eukprot:6471561-Lingulodinium_polyedra.AAC.1
MGYICAGDIADHLAVDEDINFFRGCTLAKELCGRPVNADAILRAMEGVNTRCLDRFRAGMPVVPIRAK